MAAATEDLMLAEIALEAVTLLFARDPEFREQ
jgi:hypothetical protein